MFDYLQHCEGHLSLGDQFVVLRDLSFGDRESSASLEQPSPTYQYSGPCRSHQTQRDRGRHDRRLNRASRRDFRYGGEDCEMDEVHADLVLRTSFQNDGAVVARSESKAGVEIGHGSPSISFGRALWTASMWARRIGSCAFS